MRKMFPLILVSMILYGCLPLIQPGMNIGTVKSQIDDPGFKQTNEPVRHLKLAVFFDGTISEDAARVALTEASWRLREQVGIDINSVRVMDNIKITKERTISRMEDALMEICYCDGLESGRPHALGFGGPGKCKNRTRWDIAILFTAGEGLLPKNPLVKYLGVTDDDHRRYIIIFDPDPWVVLHELVHCFALETGHQYGLMHSGLRQIPHVYYMNEVTRQDVLKNKWRSFDRTKWRILEPAKTLQDYMAEDNVRRAKGVVEWH